MKTKQSIQFWVLLFISYFMWSCKTDKTEPTTQECVVSRFYDDERNVMCSYSGFKPITVFEMLNMGDTSHAAWFTYDTDGQLNQIAFREYKAAGTKGKNTPVTLIYSGKQISGYWQQEQIDGEKLVDIWRGEFAYNTDGFIKSITYFDSSAILGKQEITYLSPGKMQELITYNYVNGNYEPIEKVVVENSNKLLANAYMMYYLFRDTYYYFPDMYLLQMQAGMRQPSRLTFYTYKTDHWNILNDIPVNNIYDATGKLQQWNILNAAFQVKWQCQ